MPEGQFLKGVANSGNRSDALEMLEMCFKQLPALPVPSIQAASRRVGWSIVKESRAGINKPRREGPKSVSQR
jgi:hypothetical protein